MIERQGMDTNWVGIQGKVTLKKRKYISITAGRKEMKITLSLSKLKIKIILICFLRQNQ